MYIPGHITGFFKICRGENVLKTGSIGAGITLNKGVTTTLVKGKGNIYFNNKKIDLCPTKEVINNFKNAIDEYKDNNLINNDKINNKISNNLINNKINNNLKLKNYDIIHNSQLPIGCGLGISGGCALGTVYELKELMGFHQMDSLELLKIAHISEVKCGTGLGDVMGQYFGGFIIRKGPGFPPDIKKINIMDRNKYYIVIEVLGKRETSSIINNPKWINKINKTSDKLLNKLLKNPTLNNFMKLSYIFAKDTGLASEEILSLCDDLNPITEGCSQAMLGNTIFALCTDNNIKEALSILKNPIVCKIYEGNHE
ncbi:MAG TPA: pantothenate kinase [Methanothermococcus okinawensis]|uniref:Pantoate kinase n=1 Tax=Methanothermococcus okinawensis TaxID=155863 RepID=A0A832YS78_9EURY|nr:pantothenate kinase [Methanothermococcus okinawensis]